MDEHTKAIRDLNDRFRNSLTDAPGSVPGQVLITSGVQELVAQHVSSTLEDVMNTVSAFDNFEMDNDPYGEHDFGAFDLLGKKLFWKLDYYAPDIKSGSADPTDIGQTVQVLTIMLASEY